MRARRSQFAINSHGARHGCACLTVAIKPGPANDRRDLHAASRSPAVGTHQRPLSPLHARTFRPCEGPPRVQSPYRVRPAV